MVHVWNAVHRGGEFTLSEGVDWAFCTPLLGPACKGWGLYVTGGFAGDDPGDANADPETLRDDIKFTELTAATLASLRKSRVLTKRQASLSQFFSPIVLEALAGQDPDVALMPREADVTVMFCDLRGFSRQSERSAGNLPELLERVSQALGVMTHHILDQGGVVGDFHGDSAMGFWGWPIPQEDAALRACRAALGIRAEFAASAAQPQHRLANFRAGIGIASGRAVAGKIGTVDQVKVTVFGPVVNLASRLEGMTRQLRRPDPARSRHCRSDPHALARERCPRPAARAGPSCRPRHATRRERIASSGCRLSAAQRHASRRLRSRRRCSASRRLAQGLSTPPPGFPRRSRERLPHRLHRPTQSHPTRPLGRRDPARTQVRGLGSRDRRQSGTRSRSEPRQ